MPRALLSAPGCYRLFSYIFFEEVLFVSHIHLPGQAPDLPYRVLAQGPLDLPSENFGRDTGHSGVLLISPLHSDLADTANEAEVGGRLNFLPADRANIAVRLFAFGLCFLLRHNAGERNFKYKAVVFEGLLEGLGRICVGEAHSTVVPDFKVSRLSFGLEGLVVVYNLMQAVARVNRVFKDKEGGLIVDYVGIASALKEAMKEYSARDRQKYGDMDIGKTAYPKFQEKLQVCRDLFHGYDFSKFYTGTPLEKAQAITGGVNFVLDAKVPKRKELFAKEALLLRQAQSLCSSMTTEEERHTAAYFEAVRSTVMKITMGGGNGKPLSLKEINSQISDLLKASIQSEGVINLFESAKMGEKFSLFDPSVLEEIARMKEKNIVVEILRKLMAEQIAIYKCTNVVQATTFSEKITLLMNTYYNGLITNEEVIKELLKTAEEINALRKEGEKLGLTEEELAFYDALTKPEHIKDFYENETLIALTRELTEMLRKNRTIDWQKKETARAGMRKMVKRLLKKYKYPPEKREDAIETVMSQCELWTDNMAE